MASRSADLPQHGRCARQPASSAAGWAGCRLSPARPGFSRLWPEVCARLPGGQVSISQSPGHQGSSRLQLGLIWLAPAGQHPVTESQGFWAAVPPSRSETSPVPARPQMDTPHAGLLWDFVTFFLPEVFSPLEPLHSRANRVLGAEGTRDKAWHPRENWLSDYLRGGPSPVHSHALPQHRPHPRPHPPGPTEHTALKGAAGLGPPPLCPAVGAAVPQGEAEASVPTAAQASAPLCPTLLPVGAKG